MWRWLIASMVLWTVHPAWAQATGQLRVTVIEDSLDELPVPNVKVTLSNGMLVGGRRQLVTDQNGEALFTALSPDRYTLTASHAAFEETIYESVSIYINRTTQQVVRLPTLNPSLVRADDASSLYRSDLSFEVWEASTRDWSATHTPSHRPLDLADRRFIAVCDRSGRPRQGVPIAVRAAGSGRVLLTATSHADGRVPFYPRLFPNSDVGYRVWVDGQPTLWHAEADLAIRTSKIAEVRDLLPIDVVLALDTTSTMIDEIAQLHERFEPMVNEWTAQRPAIDLRIGLVRYRDRGERYLVQSEPLTADLAHITEQVRATTGAGGGDAPEALEAALAAALSPEMRWRTGAIKLLFVFSDAAPHLDQGAPPYTDSALRALSEGIAIYPVAARGMPPSGAYIFRQIAEVSGGHASLWGNEDLMVVVSAAIRTEIERIAGPCHSDMQ